MPQTTDKSSLYGLFKDTPTGLKPQTGVSGKSSHLFKKKISEMPLLSCQTVGSVCCPQRRTVMAVLLIWPHNVS